MCPQYISISGNLSSLSELVSEGKSGSLFYYTTDGRFMIKTVSAFWKRTESSFFSSALRELQNTLDACLVRVCCLVVQTAWVSQVSKDTALFMRSILFDYYKHVSTCSNTLLTRFCGLHAIRMKDKSGQVLGRKGAVDHKMASNLSARDFGVPGHGLRCTEILSGCRALEAEDLFHGHGEFLSHSGGNASPLRPQRVYDGAVFAGRLAGVRQLPCMHLHSSDSCVENKNSMLSGFVV